MLLLITCLTDDGTSEETRRATIREKSFIKNEKKNKRLVIAFTASLLLIGFVVYSEKKAR